MRFKRLTTNDVKYVIEVTEKFRSSITTREKVKEFLGNNQNYIIAGLSDNKVVGFLLSYELQRYDGQNNMMYIHEVQVLEEYRKRGIGKRLVNEIKEICKTKDLSKMFLITNESNIPAVNLYESTGANVTENDNIVYCYEKSVISG